MNQNDALARVRAIGRKIARDRTRLVATMEQATEAVRAAADTGASQLTITQTIGLDRATVRAMLGKPRAHRNKGDRSNAHI